MYLALKQLLSGKQSGTCQFFRPSNPRRLSAATVR
jgi:hypothetical protein